MRIYGKRPAPILADEDERLIETSLKRRRSESGAPVEHTARVGSRTDNHDSTIDVNRHAGESPLLAWLNQIITPAAAPKPTSSDDLHQEPAISKSEELLNQEKKDLEFFKNVHIATTSEPAMAPGLPDNWSDLELPAQIYYRNIKDRYPSLPSFLTRRLAIANFHRAIRLERQRITKGINELDTTLIGDLGSPAQLSAQNPWSSSVQVLKWLSRSKDAQFTFQPKWIHDEVPPRLSPQSDVLHEYQWSPASSSRENYWTAGLSSRRPSSLRSDSSSKNSSLRGLDVMDSSYQCQKLVESPKESRFSPSNKPNHSLFPAPVEWNSVKYGRETFKFSCDICGELVCVERRRDWQ